MRILVTGGCGYVGSHLVRALLDAGHQVGIVDDLSSGHRQTVPEGVSLTVGSAGDTEVLDAAAAIAEPAAIMHLAAKCSVEESMREPRMYYQANLRDSLGLLDWMAARGVPHIVHSSTCAVYGNPDASTINEDTCPRPMNPYGASKLAVDFAIESYESAFPLSGVALRYFNAAGAHPDGILGEDKTPASNLIPILLQAALGTRASVSIFGTDYPTPDGTGVRDYIHIMDLAAAHIAALDYLVAGNAGTVFNLGTETGHSVLEMVSATETVTGRSIATDIKPRRAGDPATLVADSARAHSQLGWRATADINQILADAWSWRSANPEGYSVGAQT